MKIQVLKAKFLIFAAAALCVFAIVGAAQTTTFTYQGRFTDSTVLQPTNGIYSMHFALFDSVSGGSQSGASVDIPNVQVVNGIFTVPLDFTAASFDGTPRFLQITVGNTLLSPRQEITSAPYAIVARNAFRAIDSTKLGGIDADQYVTGQVVRSVNNLNGNLTLAPGSNITITPVGNTLTIASTSANGINNQTSLQTGANFNIDGTGAANIFNAATQFNIGGNRFLSGGGGNIFAGSSAGAANTTGGDNAFVGTNAGLSNTTGYNNSFVGTDAGRTNNTGNSNSFFGRSAGFANTTGVSNSFFGEDAGRFNLTGGNNAFFGISAGGSNTTGGDNSFVGARAGNSNLIGGNNSFFGTDAGRSNTASDNSFFGRSAGFANTSGTRNVFAGEDAGRFNTTGGGNSFVGIQAGQNNTTGANNTMVGDSANVGANNLNFATALGSGATVSTSNTVVLGRTADTVVAPNLLQVNNLGASGATSLCRNASNQISTCAAGGGGGGFIDNSTVLQPTSNFNISGSGTAGGTLSANVVNSTTTYKIGGTTVFSTPNQTSVVVGRLSNHNLVAPHSTFFGYKTGAATNGFSQANTFIGSEAGETNTSGGNNSFIGKDAGFFNSSGSFNSFFGSSAGISNTSADANSFFGYEAGKLNSTGTRNSFFGFQAGIGSTLNDNSLFGYNAKTTGSSNVAVGANATANGNNNTIIGSNSSSANNVFHSTAIGADAQVTSSNTVVLGTGSDTVVAPNVLTSPQIKAGYLVTNNIYPNSGNTIQLGSNTNIALDTVNVPYLLDASSVHATTVKADGGIFSTLKLLFPAVGYKPMCYDDVNKFIGVCPGSSNAAGSVGDSVKKQSAQIERQAEQIKQQQAQIEALKQIVCEMNPAAKICGK